jgi:hypothetical protein
MRVLRRHRFLNGTLHARISGWTSLCAWWTVWAFLFGTAPVARAAVSLLLEQPYGKLNLINPAGHSAIYLNHVCADSPLKLRPCRPGELGVVLSRYNDISGHDWVAMPLIPYLYAVDSVSAIPKTVDREGEKRLREAYRKQYLAAIAPDGPDGTAAMGNWYELLGSAFDRTIYGFRADTTPEQDADLIASFNDRRNVERYNGAFRNCADFARLTINRFYPHAIRRNYIADFGITSPKSVARSFSHYASKHPEIGFEVFMIPQVKGSLPRSHSNTGVAEGILKRYSPPLIIISPVSTAVVFAAYVGHGRFSMPKHASMVALVEAPGEDAPGPIVRPFPAIGPELPGPTVGLIPAHDKVGMISTPGNIGSEVSLVRVELVP